MGIIRAALGAVGTGLADQWLEVFEAADMDDKLSTPMGQAQKLVSWNKT